jgi:hypothetical protein
VKNSLLILCGIGLAFFLATCEVASAATNLLINGDFEAGNFTGWNTSKIITGAGIDRGSHPQIVTSPVHSGSYSAYFYCADQHGYPWWPASGRIDQARQTIENVDYNMLSNMVFEVWSMYRGRYIGFYHHASGGSIEFRVSDSSNNTLSRHIIRHLPWMPWTHNMYALHEDPAPASFTIYHDGADGTHGPWRHTVLDIREVINDPIAGIDESEKTLVDHIDIVIYAWSYGTADYDAELWVDDIAVYLKTIPATIDIDPDTLNLNSKGNWITAYIELPEGYDVSEIDVSTIKLNNKIEAELKPTEIGDYDEDNIPDMMVKFDRKAVHGILVPADEVQLTVTGKVAGVDFEGSDTIRVIDKEKNK